MSTTAAPTSTSTLASGSLAVEPAVYAPARSSRGLWRDARRRLLRNRLAVAGMILIGFVILVALLADVLPLPDPAYQFPNSSYARPTAQHLLGNDQVGRDVLSRLVHGARLSLSVAVFAQAIILVIGLTIGGLAGYFGGRIDNWLMRFTDVFYAFPDLLFVIIITTALGASLTNIFLAIGLVNWTDLARLVRGQLLTLRERDFVLAARSLGASTPRLLLQHLLPNSAGPVIVRLTYGIPQAIFTEAVLSFIGLGVRPPQASWGTMVQQGNEAIFSAPHLVLFPAIAIALTMLAFNFLGDGLRDALDPQNTR
ncbi:MAG: ABC transporter permease [Chloroflexi bacterium]|nr:ABC transporter permease [Chloroflexota bacterium]